MGKSTEEYNYFDIKISIKFTALDKSMKCTQVLFKIHETFTSFTPPEVCLYDCSHHLSWCNLNSFSDFFVMQCHVVMHKTEVNSWRVFEEAKNIIMLCYIFTQLRKAALHVVMSKYLMKWRTLQRWLSKIPNYLLFINSLHISVQALVVSNGDHTYLCLKHG